jgi:hypothetical protein
MCASITYGVHICIEDKSGGVRVWGTVMDGEYGLKKGGRFFGDRIDLNISLYRKVAMSGGKLYGINDNDILVYN